MKPLPDAALLPHRRRNALTGEWVLCSPHRATRPWQGQQESAAREQRPAHDPSCYLCAGNRRANGELNPDYRDTFVFENDFRALLDQEAPASYTSSPLLQRALGTVPAAGIRQIAVTQGPGWLRVSPWDCRRRRPWRSPGTYP